MQQAGSTGADAAGGGVGIELDADSRVHWALEHNGVPVVREVRCRNGGTAELRNLVVEIRCEPPFSATFRAPIPAIPAGGTFTIARPDVRLDGARLRRVLERERARLVVSIGDAGGATLACVERDVEILAHNEWNAAAPELLASFVLPNHRGVARVLKEARALLAAATGDPAFDGYQRRSRPRVRGVADAIYRALQRFDVTYAEGPASFEVGGQKIRLPDQVLDQRLGSCLDLATLVAACLEQAGLNPLIFLVKGHAFAGVWLAHEELPAAVAADVDEVAKLVRAGEILPFDPTVACQRPPAPFPAAIGAAEDALLSTVRPFSCALDIRGARRLRVLPLPLAGGEASPGIADPTAAAAAADPGATAGPAAPGAPSSAAAPSDSPAAPRRPKTKLDLWREGLLDLTLRNRLLNFRESARTLPLDVADAALLEDLVSAGDDVTIEPAPGPPPNDARDAALADLRGAAAQVAAERARLLAAGRVPSTLRAGELARRATLISRAARLELEESGGSTLALALGFLRWFESDDATEPRRAPLLLLPVALDRPDARGRPRLRVRDDETRLNLTLCEKLRADFGIDFSALAELPLDEAGIDVARVLDLFRHAVARRARFAVEDAAAIGFFGFAKFLMYRDLDAHEDALLKSAHVRRLAGLADAPPPEPSDFVEARDLDAKGILRESRLVVDADSSQHAAVEAALRGRSFVLQGPPGTGKSQTITNVIAGALAAGKRVLFVAEKRAALDVVAKRLRRVGLGDACLELHSSKADKRAVIAELARTLEEAARPADPGFAALGDAADAGARRADAFATALHAPGPFGVSAFAAHARALALATAPRLAVDVASTATTDAATHAARLRALEDLAGAAVDVGPPAEHPFSDCALVAWTPLVARAAESALTALRDAASTLDDAARSAAAALGSSAPPAIAAAEGALAALRLLARGAPPGARDLASRPDAAAASARLSSLAARLRALKAERDALAPRWTPELFALDLAGLAAEYRKNSDALAPFRWFALRGPKATLERAARAKLGTAPDLLRDLETALKAKDAEAAVEAEAPFAGPILGAAWRGKETAADDVDATPRFLEAWGAAAAALGSPGLPPPALAAAAADDAAKKLAAAFGSYAAAWDACVLAIRVEGPRPTGGAADVAATAARRLAELPRLRPWTVFAAAETRAAEVGAESAVRALRSGACPAPRLRDAFERGFLEAWLDRALSDVPELKAFQGREHERALARYRDDDRAWLAAGGPAAAALVAAARPRVDGAAAAASEVGIVLAEARKKRRQLPVRRLLERTPNLLPRLKPCLLMSPLSVAQYLPADGAPFDLVVFDEASQITPSDAIGALARGRQAIVVGDSKQLPPTAFFEPGGGDDEDLPTDGAPGRDLESVLDEMVAARTPSLMLRWHYRSRDESLIAFSNFHYYGNRLLTFPGPGGGGAELGVALVPVAGTFDRAKSRTNRAEAEAVAADVVRRLRDPALRAKSVGVVTFNQPQQLMIEDLLDAAREAHPEIDRFFTDAVPEPVFVKNLENVQGDERDVMLFSITYAPDATGKVAMNFGPLNRQGGERRLNVAITRARERLAVFAGLKPEHIDLSRTSALGVAHLRTFLRYAAEGPRAIAEALAPDPSAAAESPFERDVGVALAARGHRVARQVGCSGYRVDLAVADPDVPGRMPLGIECDGASYRSGATARDRDRLRPAVLENLGWRMARVWSLDWRADREGELKRLDELIAAAKAAGGRPETPGANAGVKSPEAKPSEAGPAAAPKSEAKRPPEPPPTTPSSAAIPVSAPDPYVAFEPKIVGKPAQLDDPDRTAEIAELMRAVAETEGPIHRMTAFRAVATAYRAPTLGAKVKARLENVLEHAVRLGHVDLHGDFLWRRGEDPETFDRVRVPTADGEPRDVDQVAPEELSASVRRVLRSSIALPAEDLARAAAAPFGWRRLTPRVREAFAAAVDREVAAARARRDGDTVRLP